MHSNRLHDPSRILVPRLTGTIRHHARRRELDQDDEVTAATELRTLTAGRAGHIRGTSPYDLSGSDENRRDLSRKSERMSPTFAMVRDSPARDPAHRPTHPQSQSTPLGRAARSADQFHVHGSSPARRVSLIPPIIHARLSAVWCEDCGRQRNAFSLGSALIVAACTVCGAAPMLRQQPTLSPAVVHVIETLPGSPMAVYRPISEASLLVKLEDDSPHDHREFDPDTPPAIEYGTDGDSIGLSPFTSVPGAARPGMMCPGMV